MIRKHHSQPKPLMGKPLICNSKPLFRLNPPLTILSDLFAGNPPISATKGPFKLCSAHFSAPRVSTAQGWASNDESLPVFSCSPLSLGPSVPLICWHSYPCWVKQVLLSLPKKGCHIQHAHTHFYWPATLRHQPKRILLQVTRAVICLYHHPNKQTLLYPCFKVCHH